MVLLRSQKGTASGSMKLWRTCEGSRVDAMTYCAKVCGFAHSRYAEHFGTGVQRRPADHHGAVPVTVRLDDCHELRVWSEKLLEFPHICGERVKIDDCPGRPTAECVHRID